MSNGQESLWKCGLKTHDEFLYRGRLVSVAPPEKGDPDGQIPIYYIRESYEYAPDRSTIAIDDALPDCL